MADQSIEQVLIASKKLLQLIELIQLVFQAVDFLFDVRTSNGNWRHVVSLMWC